MVFDAFDTLFLNTRDLWRDCFARICKDQGLTIASPDALYDAWAVSETDFRHGRIDVETMTAAEPFQTYSEVWHDAFVGAFSVAWGSTGDADAAVVVLPGGPGHAARLSRRSLGVLEQLRDRVPIAVLSNADDAFLYPVLERHSVTDTFVAGAIVGGGASVQAAPAASSRMMLERLGTPCVARR